jgi:hypothetical protein
VGGRADPLAGEPANPAKWNQRWPIAVAVMADRHDPRNGSAHRSPTGRVRPLLTRHAPYGRLTAMGKRPGPVEIIWKNGDAAFAYLVRNWNFLGPERTDSGIAYHRPDLHVAIGVWAWKNEAGFDTRLRWTDPATGQQHRAGLDDLYVAAGLGPHQHVPGAIGGGRTIAKRVAKHADALRQLMPYLHKPGTADLFDRC